MIIDVVIYTKYLPINENKIRRVIEEPTNPRVYPR